MLSICIPIYNFNISEFLQKLIILIETSGIPVELVLADDCSEKSSFLMNKEKAEQFGIKIRRLEKNTGRSAIRNYLCKEANFENILFMDCDSIIMDNEFLEKYVPYLNQQHVVYGGTKYQQVKPESKFLLHWYYGQKREIKRTVVRNTFPTKYFKTNNFLVTKSILTKCPFNENLKEYGHEDTLLGINFYQNNIPVTHIENPVLHVGLETNEDFLLKTEAGIRNLYVIMNQVSDPVVLHQHVNLLGIFSKLENLKLVRLVALLWILSKPILLILIKRFYIMRALDIYKLGFLCSIQKKSTALQNDAF